MIVAGEKKIYTGRNLPNVLAFVTAEEETPTETAPDNEAPSESGDKDTGGTTTGGNENTSESGSNEGTEGTIMKLLKAIYELLKRFFN